MEVVLLLVHAELEVPCLKRALLLLDSGSCDHECCRVEGETQEELGALDFSE